MKTTRPWIYRFPLGVVTLCSLLWMALPVPSNAAAADGVRCPNGYESHYESGSKTLRCKRSQNTFRPAVCDPRFGDHVVYRTGKGHDSCVSVSDAALQRPASASDPRGRVVVCTVDSSDPTPWVIDIDPNSQDRDRCKAVSVEWIYPSQQ
jgi:hypothetical protein